MRTTNDVGVRIAGAVALACGLGFSAVSLPAQDFPAVLLVLDETAIDHGPPPHLIASEVANDLIGNVGLRDQIPYFGKRIGDLVTLPSSDMGNDGWFAIKSVPPSWASEPGADDGFQNYWLAGPGLGSPDDEASRVTRLTQVPDVVALHAAGLGGLTGRTVCAVVYDGDISVKQGTPSTAGLDGINLGVVAFEVSSVDASSDSPAVTVRILDSRAVCGALTPFAAAPDQEPAPAAGPAN